MAGVFVLWVGILLIAIGSDRSLRIPLMLRNRAAETEFLNEISENNSVILYFPQAR